MEPTEKNHEIFFGGMVMLISQNVIVTNPFFTEPEIRKYIQTRKLYHPLFVASAAVVADELEKTGAAYGEQAARDLRALSELSVNQTNLAIVKAMRVLQRLRPQIIRKMVDLPPALRQAIRAAYYLAAEEASDNKAGASAYMDLFKAATLMTGIPAPARTLFRRMLKLGVTFCILQMDRSDSDPGAWFQFSQEEKDNIRHRVKELIKKQDEILSGPASERHGEWAKVADELASIQARSGVNLKIIEGGDESLDETLKREAKLEVDGLTAFLVQKIEEEMWEHYEYKKEKMKFKARLTKADMNKMLTRLRKAKTFPTVIRVISELVERKLLPRDFLERTEQLGGVINQNKAVRDGVPIAAIPFRPMKVEEFQSKHGAGHISFSEDYTEEEKEEILGRVSQAVSTLEAFFGKGFCGKHAKRLEFAFDEARLSYGAGASYFAWEDRNHWQPRVRFGKRYHSLLAHELSHFMEDLLGYTIRTSILGSGREFPDSDIFMRTGVTLQTWVNYAEKEEGYYSKITKEVPELLEFARTVIGSEDYRRWGDMIGSLLEFAIPRAIKEVTGKEPWEQERYKNIDTELRYKSELPAEIVERAVKIFTRANDGDDRKLRYHQSGVEIWARSCEQYIYTKLSRAGIVNPWLTQVSYDTKPPIDMPQFFDESTFEEKIEPIMDRLFERLRRRGVIALLLLSSRRGRCPSTDPPA